MGRGGAGARKVARSMLDELMGKDRNKPLSERRRKKNHFSDTDYCKYYLLGFCPYMLFTNTKSDLGQCNLNHSDIMRDQWEKQTDGERASYRFEDDMQVFLEDIVRGIEHRIGKRKEKSQADLDQLPPPDPEMLSQKAALEKEIENCTEEMDSLNDEGRFEEARAMMEKIESLQQEVKRKAREIENKRTLETGKVLGVCDICGVLIGVGDEQADARHLVGKQHLGYEQIRNKLKDLRATQEKRRELRKQFREEQMEKERNDPSKDDDRNARREVKREAQRENRDKDYDRYKF